MHAFIREIAYVCIGGIIGIMGSFAQTAFASRKDFALQRREKREEAYLCFVDALLTVVVDDSRNEVSASKFWPTFRKAQAKIYLYGSKKIIKLVLEFQLHLDECWENHCDMGTEQKKQILIDAIRKELGIAQ